MTGLALESQQSYTALQVWRRVAGKLPDKKGSGSAGQEPADYDPECAISQEGKWHSGLYQQYSGQQEQSSDCPSILITAKATP